MSYRKAFSQLGALAVIMCLGLSPASAITFASFGFTGGTPFQLAGDVFSASATGSFTVSTLVSPVPYVGVGPFNVVMNLSGTLDPGTANSATFNNAPGSTSISQNIKTLSFTIVGQNNAGANAGLNGMLLLSGGINASNGQLQGNVNNTTHTSTAGLGSSGSDADIYYSSSILDFLPGSRDFSFTLNSITPPVLDVSGPPITIPNLGTFKSGDVKDFTASISANFAATPGPLGHTASTPEPGSLTLLCGFGVSAAAMTLRKRRRS